MECEPTIASGLKFRCQLQIHKKIIHISNTNYNIHNNLLRSMTNKDTKIQRQIL